MNSNTSDVECCIVCKKPIDEWLSKHHDCIILLKMQISGSIKT